jgi:hypothetical protein
MSENTTTLETKLLRIVEEQRPDAIALLDALLRAAREGEAAMQAIVARELRNLGYEIDIFEADQDALSTHPEFSLLP